MKSRTSPELGHFPPFLKLDFGLNHIKVEKERKKKNKKWTKQIFPDPAVLKETGKNLKI